MAENQVVEIKSRALAESTAHSMITVGEIAARQKMLDELIEKQFVKDLHYGRIPGTAKDTLYQPGAQLFNTMFQVFPKYEKQVEYLQNNHINVVSVCTLNTLEGKLVGSGCGSCSSMESKYRYVNEMENTGQMIPPEYWKHWKTDPEKAQMILGGKGFTKKKAEDGQWYVFKSSGKVERADIADVWNTILKIANKRAYVDATNNTWALSGRFTQDINDPEDQPEEKPEAAKTFQKESSKAKPKQETSKTMQPIKGWAEFDHFLRNDKIDGQFSYDYWSAVMNELDQSYSTVDRYVRSHYDFVLQDQSLDGDFEVALNFLLKDPNPYTIAYKKWVKDRIDLSKKKPAKAEAPKEHDPIDEAILV